MNLELTQGVYGSMPIMFSVGGDSSYEEHGLAEQLNKTISRDLSLSGEFKISQGDQFVPTMDKISQIQKKGITSVGFLEIKNDGGDNYSASLLFYDLMIDKNIDFTRPKVITRYNFNKVNAKDFAHVCADDLYKYITGVDGVFTTKLAYVVHKKRPGMGAIYNLEIANYDGSDSTVILESYEPIMSPSWSNDGSKLAYVSFEGKKSSVFVQNIATGAREKISDINGVNGSPSWSKADDSLAIVLSDAGFTKIHTVNLDSKNEQPLTDGYSIDTEPEWSKDGESLFFTSNRGGRPQIYKYEFASKLVERVTFKGDYNASPVLSPDLKYLVFMHREGGLFSLASQNLYKGTMKLISHDGSEESPDISPNGRIVVYASKYGARGVLGFVSLDGAIHWRLPAINGSVQEPSWSPFMHKRDSFLVDETKV
ncbi:MAG: Tol-Pal system beta propeller repeat protein TolB [Legionellales bacterium]|nr:Tol-Pal system beta propeller repeat protein TolB [Legionellales bacterium]